LYGFKHPSQYDRESLVKPASKANTKLILAEEDNIQHILASLALKVTRQSVIIAKLSSYPRKNRTKKALWKLDNLRRSLHLLNYVDSPQFQRNIQRALNRGESYHKLVRAVAYANGGKLRVRTDQEQQLWSECSRLLANCIMVKFQQRYQTRQAISLIPFDRLDFRTLGYPQNGAPFSPPILGVEFRCCLAASRPRSHTRRAS
jgi:TnpA family transposase